MRHGRSVVAMGRGCRGDGGSTKRVFVIGVFAQIQSRVRAVTGRGGWQDGRALNDVGEGDQMLLRDEDALSTVLNTTQVIHETLK